MPVTIHVNGTSNSLVHKGSMGIVKSTLPDVCKTPSPGGPVPVPYPVIVSMSSQLVKGTTTVKADGGNMCAVKGSELSMCNGDEAGTAGGVKSSTFMKEATWLLYSFDVKLDGKNACRLSDKLQMNHGNSACLGGIVQKPVKGGNVLVLECNPDLDWDDCQKAQMRAKAREMNKIAQEQGGLKLRPYNTRQQQIIANQRAIAEDYQAEFRSQHADDMKGSGKNKNAYHSCAKNNGKPVDADHINEIQTYGNPKGDFLMLDSSVNRSSGSQIRGVRSQHKSGVTVYAVETSGCD
jgi:hypothetical protein